ncbi:hypothetical protein LXL04_028627 [Taraxacum kok-saghyz]
MPNLDNSLYFPEMSSLSSDVGCAGRKPGPEQTQAEFAEARTKVLTTTISSLWRSDRGEFSHYITWKFYMLYVSSCAIIGCSFYEH